MKIKEVEKRVELSASNIRYYEKEGLLHPKRDAGNNYREYEEEHVKRLEEIKKLRLLGISIEDIKKLYSGEILLSDVMRQRLEQLEAEQQNLELTKKICKNALEQRIEMDSLDALALDGGKAAWNARLAVILNEDCSKKIITKKQLNFQVMLILVWGYVLCAAVTVLAHGWMTASNTTARNKLLEKWGIPYPDMRDGFRWEFFIGLFILVVLAFAVRWTANMKYQIVFFHLCVLFQPPVIMLLFFQSERLSEGVSGSLPVIWLILAGYAIALWLISVVWDKFFTRVGYSILVWGIFAVVVAALNFFIQTDVLIAVISIALACLIGFFLTMEWTLTNLDSQVYNRYDAVLVSGRIINILAFLISGRGYYGYGNVFRR